MRCGAPLFWLVYLEQREQQRKRTITSSNGSETVITEVRNLSLPPSCPFQLLPVPIGMCWNSNLQPEKWGSLPAERGKEHLVRGMVMERE